MAVLMRNPNGLVTCPDCGKGVVGKPTKGKPGNNVLRHVLECEECGAVIGERGTEGEEWNAAS